MWRRIGGETTSRSPDVALPKIKDRINRVDPDVLVVDSVKLLGGLHDVADSIGYNFQLGRRSSFQQLATASTYTTSCGRVGYSVARYNMPGRAVIDRNNTFLFKELTLHPSPAK